MVLARGLNSLDDDRTRPDASQGVSWLTTGEGGTSEEIDASLEQFRSRVDDVDQLSDQVHRPILVGLIATVMTDDR